VGIFHNSPHPHQPEAVRNGQYNIGILSLTIKKIYVDNPGAILFYVRHE
jgi:hypothetical protein